MRTLILVSVAAISAVAVSAAGAAGPLVVVTADPFTNPTSQHRTAVEPDSFAYGSTVVEAAQVGRFISGGASDIGFGTSTDAGATWTRGALPGITKFRLGPYDRVSDPTVAYDARHKIWMISTLAITETPGLSGVAVLVNRSTDGIHWGKPVTVAAVPDMDKNWIVCDNTLTSPYYGRCYVEWDDAGHDGRIYMNTSTDGGLTWGPSKPTADGASGIGGQPVVRPNGVVVVPIDNNDQNRILWFTSSNGGAGWSSSHLGPAIVSHEVAGNLRASPLPSAEVDAAGRVYLVWQDCRFRSSCAANDIVMSKLASTTWTSPVRIPIHAASSTVDHFIPGIAVDPKTSGSTAHLALTYYFYPSASCTVSTCQLQVGFVSSKNGGATWTAQRTLAGPMSLSWLASTSLGPMVGDYISTSFVKGSALPFFSLASAPAPSFNQRIVTTASPLAP